MKSLPASHGAPLPVTLIGGYLGAGKTTLVNHLLRHAAGRRLAVLVNDFGALAIDADLIEAEDGDVINLAGGCVCCSFGSDLMGALMQLTQRAPRPDQVLVETSGVALPGAVAAALSLFTGVALDAVVVLADAETVRERAADRYMGETVAQQLQAADLVVLNKVDLAAADLRAALHAWLATMAPNAKVIDALRARLPLEAVLGVDLGAGRTATAQRLLSGRQQHQAHPLAAAEAMFERIEFPLAQPVDAGRLAAALADPRLGVIRAKGILRDRDGAPITLQLVGARAELGTLASTRAARGRLVCIGLKGKLDAAAIRIAVDGAARAGASLKEC